MSAADDPGLRVVADAAIGEVDAAFAGFGTLLVRPGAAIDATVVAGADALIVRSVTKVGAGLVAGTPVKFVGTATAGVDHLDVPALTARGITVASAPGCNAGAVVDYVLSALAVAAMHRGETWPAGGPIGVVGFGCVGRRLTARLRALGADVRVCDPPLAADPRPPAHEPDPLLAAMVPAERFVALPELLRAVSVLTLHVPRTHGGPHPTAGLLDAQALAQLPPRALVINTARGGVVDDAALLRWLRAGRGDAVLDVWQAEPAVPADLVRRTLLATPHIAGYSRRGKHAATAAIHRALARWCDREPWFEEYGESDDGPTTPIPLRDASPPALAHLVAEAIDLRPIDHALRQLVRSDPAASPAAFEALRVGYPLRDELVDLVVDGPRAAASAISALGATSS